ncbi:MAG: NADH-quinone oxidoreductase subunit, partial [Acidimicrobiaceae bacterium]
MADDDDAAVATDDAPATNAAPEIATRYGVPVTESSGQAVLHPRREHLAELVMELRDEHGFGMCIDVTAVDYLAYELPRRLPASVEPERFELIVGLLS